MAALEDVLKPFLRKTERSLSKKALRFLWSEWRPIVAELRPPPFCRGEIAALIKLVMAHLDDPAQCAMPPFLKQHSGPSRRWLPERSTRAQFVIEPTAAQSSAIATIRTAFGMPEKDWTDSEIAHLVLATALARLNQSMDCILQESVYSADEGFEGFECSDEKTRQAIQDVRRQLADEGEGEAWKIG